MSIADEVYMKHHVSELVDLDAPTVKLWKEGQNRWCVRTHGMTSDEYYAKLERRLKDKGPLVHGDDFTKEEKIVDDFDGVGGYGSSGRKPLPKKYHK